MLSFYHPFAGPYRILQHLSYLITNILCFIYSYVLHFYHYVAAILTNFIVSVIRRVDMLGIG